MSTPRVTVYSRPGCHLCEEALVVVAKVCADLGETYDEVNIDDDATLTERFGEEVPVTFVDGKPRSATVTASEGLRTLYVPHAAFTGLVENDATVAKELLVALCGRIRQIDAEAHSD